MAFAYDCYLNGFAEVETRWARFWGDVLAPFDNSFTLSFRIFNLPHFGLCLFRRVGGAKPADRDELGKRGELESGGVAGSRRSRCCE
jgi:hypothetical protein